MDSHAGCALYDRPSEWPLRDALEVIDPSRSLIDHVLVGRGVEVLSARHLDSVNQQASDHFPVLAEVTLRSPGEAAFGRDEAPRSSTTVSGTTLPPCGMLKTA